MAGTKGKSGQHRKVGDPALPDAGRKPVQGILRKGALVYVSQVWGASEAYPQGAYTELGKGIVGEVTRIKGGTDRLVVIPQVDGSEVRIVIGSEVG